MAMPFWLLEVSTFWLAKDFLVRGQLANLYLACTTQTRHFLQGLPERDALRYSQ